MSSLEDNYGFERDSLGREHGSASESVQEGGRYELGAAREFREAIDRMSDEMSEMRERVGVRPRDVDLARQFATCETVMSGLNLLTDTQKFKVNRVTSLAARYGADLAEATVTMGRMSKSLNAAGWGATAVEMTCGALSRYYGGEEFSAAVANEGAETFQEFIHYDIWGERAEQLFDATRDGFSKIPSDHIIGP